MTAAPADGGGFALLPLGPEHRDGVLAAYADGIATGIATFETRVPEWAEWDSARLPGHRYVAVGTAEGGNAVAGSAVAGSVVAGSVVAGSAVAGSAVAAPVGVLGWVAVSAVSSRAAYAGVVEHSIYVAAAARGRGVGAALLARLVESCDAGGIWTIQSGVFPENGASLALHERFGFRRVGVRERIGRLDGRWRDVVLLERRSPVVGV